jgi:hypothetical protein
MIKKIFVIATLLGCGGAQPDPNECVVAGSSTTCLDPVDSPYNATFYTVVDGVNQACDVTPCVSGEACMLSAGLAGTCK